MGTRNDSLPAMPAGGERSVDLVVLGSSGHAREVISIAECLGGYRVLGCVGPRPAEIRPLPAPWLGDDDWLTQAPAAVQYVIGIGSGRIRARLDRSAGRLGRPTTSLVHPAAVVGPRTSLDDGCVLWPGAILTTDVALGRHVHIGTKASVGHDSTLGDFVTLLPGSTVAGSTSIGAGVTIGAGATVIDGISIGTGALVGAGAVVIRDVPADSVVVGVPARLLRSSENQDDTPESSHIPVMRGTAWDA
ncbi:acetyltransferase [Micromonospora parva]|uniref:acetyltransferase n=2 Tax=Micromonospora parva TaxID=1464048 RepID=UPI0033EA42E8